MSEVCQDCAWSLPSAYLIKLKMRPLTETKTEKKIKTQKKNKTEAPSLSSFSFIGVIILKTRLHFKLSLKTLSY